MFIENKFNIGDIVYSKMDSDCNERLVLEIKIIPGSIMYNVSMGDTSAWFYEFELSKEKNYVKN